MREGHGGADLAARGTGFAPSLCQSGASRASMSGPRRPDATGEARAPSARVSAVAREGGATG
jgi:hypothetical protein